MQQVAAVFDVEVSTLTKGRRGKNEPWSQRGDISDQATVGSAVAGNGAVGRVYAQVRSQQTTDQRLKNRVEQVEIEISQKNSSPISMVHIFPISFFGSYFDYL